MAGFSILSFFQKFIGRKSIRYALLLIGIAGLAFIFLQVGSKYLLKQWLLENGADSVSIETMWLNPFTGKLSLNGVDIRRDGEVVFSNDRMYFNIGMFSLFEKDAFIQQAILKDIIIDIHRQENGELRIGFYSLQSGRKKEIEKNEILAPWTLKAKELLANNININYYQPGLDLNLKIDSARAQSLDSGKEDNTGSLTLSGHLNGAPLHLEISRFLLTPAPTLAGELSLTDFPLKEIEGLFKQLSSITGTATVSGPFSIQSVNTEKINYSYNGKIEFKDSALGNESWTASGSTGWNGILQYKNLGNNKMEVIMDGKLSAQSLQYQGKDIELAAQSAELTTNGNSRLKFDEGMTLFTDSSLQFMDVAGGIEKNEFDTSSATWHGTVEFITDKNDDKSTVTTNGDILLKETNLVIAETGKLRQPLFNTAGKGQIALSDDLQISYSGETSLSGTEVNSEQFAFTSEKISYSGQTVYEAPSEDIAALQMDGLINAESFDLMQNDPELRWTVKSTEITNDFKVALGSTPLLTGTAGLLIKSGKLLHKEQTAASLEQLTMGKLTGDNQGNFRIPEITFGPLALYSSPLLPVDLTLNSGQLKGFTSGKMQNYAIDSIAIESIMLPFAADQRLDLSVSALEIADVVSSNLNNLAVGMITLQKLTLPSAENRTFGFSMDSAKISSINSPNLKDYTAEELNLVQPVMTKKEPESRYFNMEEIAAQKIKVGSTTDNGREIAIERVSGRQADFFLNSESPIAFLNEIEASTLNWTADQGTHIQLLEGKGLQAEYTSTDNSEEEEKAGQDQQDETPGLSNEIPLQIDKITLTGSNRIVYTNPTLPETFTAAVNIEALNITDIDLTDIDQHFNYELSGYVDQHSTLTVSGTAAPLANPQSWEHLLKLQWYSLANLSPFFIKSLGTRLTGGKLDLDSQLDISGNNIKMDNKLRIQGIETKTLEQDRLDQFNKKLPVSLDTALSFLRSDDGIITLSLPIDGKLSDLDVNYTDLFVTALSESITSSVVPMLAYTVLGPTGALAYFGMQMGKKLLNNELPELVYEPRAIELTTDQKQVLDKVGKRLADKMKKQEDLSIYIYPKVAPGEITNGINGSLLDKQQRQDLYELGVKRANKVRQYLLQNFALRQKNLQIFQPGINYDEKAQGIVSFMQ
ncbi:MAG: DUF748 domain-containing protein [Desulforhopalus sp.]